MLRKTLTNSYLVGFAALALACGGTTKDDTDAAAGPDGGGTPDASAGVAAFEVSAVTGSPSEDNDTATFTVSLSRAPSAEVSMTVTSNDLSEGTVDVDTLTFTTANWDTAQTVTVTGVDDDVADGDTAFQVVVGEVTSADADFDGLSDKNVALTNIDNDVIALLVADNTGTTTEAGGTATFTLALGAKPSADVTVTLADGDASEGTVDITTITFTTANWLTPQTITVTGQNDDIDDGDVAYGIQVVSVASADAAYAALTPSPVPLTNLDDDTAGITVGAISGHTTEQGGTATFTLVLNSEPTAGVTVNFNVNDATEGALSTTSVVFDAINWDQPQTVTVIGQPDAITDGNITYQVVFAATTSTDTIYAAITPASFDVVNDDVLFCANWPGDNFEDGNISDWTIGAGYSASNSTNAAANGTSLGLEFSGGGSHYQGLVKTFAATQPSYVSIWMQPDANTGNHRNYLVMGDDSINSNNGILFMYAYASTNRWRFVGGGGDADGPTVVPGQWYHFEFAINWTAKTIAISVDGVEVAAALPFRAAATTALTQMHLYNFSSVSTARYDEIAMVCN